MSESSGIFHGASERRPFEQHLKSRSTWLRLLYMIAVAVCYTVAKVVTTVVVIGQFLHVLFTGETNAQLRAFGQSLALYTYEVLRFLTFNTETKPFPFDAEWPHGAQGQ